MLPGRLLAGAAVVGWRLVRGATWRNGPAGAAGPWGADWARRFVDHKGLLGFVSHSVFAHLQQVAEGALVDEVEARLVAMEEAEPWGIGDFGEGGGDAGQLFAGGLVIEGGLEPLVLDGPEAAEAPVGGSHFLDERLVHLVVRGEAGKVLIHDVIEGFAGLVADDDVLGQQAVTKGVSRGAALTFGGSGAAGAGTVGAGGLDLFFRRHSRSSKLRGQGRKQRQQRAGENACPT